MGTKLRLLVIFMGGLLVVATFTYPSWRPPPVPEVEEEGFPGLPEELQDDFQALSERIRTGYLLMRQRNPQQATDLLIARLMVPQLLPPEEQPLPPIEDARLIMEGEFGPIEMAEDDERELPPFSDLYESSGMVTIYLFPDDRKLLRIEDLNVVNGPNLVVALLTNPDPIAIADLGRDYQDLGPLRATTGNLNYEIPDELNINRYRSVVIYEQQYGIVFAEAKIG